MACIAWLVWFIHYIVDTIVDFIYSFIYDDENRRLITPIKHSILVESASSMAEKIRNKEVSFVSQLKGYILIHYLPKSFYLVRP